MNQQLEEKRNFKFIIFSLIGVFNTLFDLALYVIVYDLTGSILISNIIATSAAVTGSYLLNSRLTFKSKKWTVKSFSLFAGITLFGLWILQTGLIYLLTPIVNNIPEAFWQLFGPIEHTAKIIAPKLIATAMTFIWNFVWYNKVIFKHDRKHAKEAIRSAEL